jgi:polyprenyldihydroxybenzoate methyltransferase/3-demethylubiquinol 3-O-methyltransferase
LNEDELAKFSAIADTWWHSEGPFKPLHQMNPTRLAFIRSTLCRHFSKDPSSAKPFEGLKFIDIGCGGGLLSEPLARMGATVTGVDAVDKNVKIARLHADMDPVTSTIEYLCTTAEKLADEGRKFDAVLSLEVPFSGPSILQQVPSSLSNFLIFILFHVSLLIYMANFLIFNNEGHRACSKPCRVL